MYKHQGFTLVEVMVASSLMILSAVFLTSVFLDKAEEKRVAVYVSDFMTLSSASKAYVQNMAGKWPGEEEVDDYDGDGDKSGSLSCGSGFSDLESSDYIGGMESSDYTFSCLQIKGRMPILKIERDFSMTAVATEKEEDFAEWVASLLPSGTASSANVAMYIPKPITAQIVAVGSVGDGGVDNGEIDKPTCRRPRLSTMIKAACVVEATGGALPKSLGGYRVDVVDIDDGDGKKWQATLEVSYSDDPSVFSADSACDKSAFDYIVYCE